MSAHPGLSEHPRVNQILDPLKKRYGLSEHMKWGIEETMHAVAAAHELAKFYPIGHEIPAVAAIIMSRVNNYRQSEDNDKVAGWMQQHDVSMATQAETVAGALDRMTEKVDAAVSAVYHTSK